MPDFIMKPKVDFAFKEIMMDEKARTGFLAAVLHINPEDIKETHILNTSLRKLHEDDKLGILDVRILLNNDMEIDAEIQLSELEVWADRSLFYTSKMFTEQIEKGQKYDVFKKCVSISILGFKLFKNEPDFYSCFHIREDTRNFIYTDKMEFHVIELPKLPDEIRENSSDLELWAKFINAERKEELDMIAKQNVYIQSAYDRLQIISQDKQNAWNTKQGRKRCLTITSLCMNLKNVEWKRALRLEQNVVLKLLMNVLLKILLHWVCQQILLQKVLVFLLELLTQ